MANVKFCWLCSKKLYNGHCELLVIDEHERTLHKICAKDVKRCGDFIKRGNQYFSAIWTTDEGIS